MSDERQQITRVERADIQAETASTAIAAQVTAEVQARHAIAIRFPRKWDVVRQEILADCKRPVFAEKARYRKPIGDGVFGPSIRMAEACARAMGNVVAQPIVTYDDATRRVIRVVASDLEKNLTHTMETVVEKTVERSNDRGRTVIATRLNAKGQKVYIVEATEDELLMKQNAQISKALRTVLLRLVPADLLEEAMAQVIATQKNAAAKDPDAARKSLVDAFSSINVPAAELLKFVGHGLETCSAAELAELRTIYASIREGETTWTETTSERDEQRAQASDVLGGVPSTAPATSATPPPVPASAPPSSTPAPKPSPSVGQRTPRTVVETAAPGPVPDNPHGMVPGPDSPLTPMEEIEMLASSVESEGDLGELRKLYKRLEPKLTQEERDFYRGSIYPTAAERAEGGK